MLDFDKIQRLLTEHIQNEFDCLVIEFVRHNKLARHSVDRLIHKNESIYSMRLNTLTRILEAANISLKVVRGK